jgi:hypothetical protein
MIELGFWEAFFASDAWLLVAIGFIFGTFDRIVELVLELRDWFNPLFIVDEFEEGVVLRFGRYNRSVKPGLHWKWPCSIEEEITTTVVRRTSYCDVQSITSRDGRSVNSSPIIIYRIGNVKRWTLEVDDAEEALNDVTYGLNDALACQSDWSEIHTSDYAVQLTALVKEEGVTWGARVEEVKFADRAQSKSLRVWTGGVDTNESE